MNGQRHLLLLCLIGLSTPLSAKEHKKVLPTWTREDIQITLSRQEALLDVAQLKQKYLLEEIITTKKEVEQQRQLLFVKNRLNQ